MRRDDPEARANERGLDAINNDRAGYPDPHTIERLRATAEEWSATTTEVPGSFAQLLWTGNPIVRMFELSGRPNWWTSAELKRRLNTLEEGVEQAVRPRVQAIREKVRKNIAEAGEIAYQVGLAVGRRDASARRRPSVPRLQDDRPQQTDPTGHINVSTEEFLNAVDMLVSAQRSGLIKLSVVASELCIQRGTAIVRVSASGAWPAVTVVVGSGIVKALRLRREVFPKRLVIATKRNWLSFSGFETPCAWKEKI